MDTGGLFFVLGYTGLVALLTWEFVKGKGRVDHRCMTSNVHRCECGRMGCSVCKRWHVHRKGLTYG